MERDGNAIVFTPEEAQALGCPQEQMDIDKIDLVGMEKRLQDAHASIIEAQAADDFRNHPHLGEALEEAMRLQESRRYLGELVNLIGGVSTHLDIN
jgi:hypothetical protein